MAKKYFINEPLKSITILPGDTLEILLDSGQTYTVPSKLVTDSPFTIVEDTLSRQLCFSHEAFQILCKTTGEGALLEEVYQKDKDAFIDFSIYIAGIDAIEEELNESPELTQALSKLPYLTLKELSKTPEGREKILEAWEEARGDREEITVKPADKVEEPVFYRLFTEGASIEAIISNEPVMSAQGTYIDTLGNVFESYEILPKEKIEQILKMKEAFKTVKLFHF